MKMFPVLAVVAALAFVGCQSAQMTAFAPFAARLEPIPGGGAQHFVLLNTSVIDLHNFSFSAFVWNDNNPNPLLKQRPINHFVGSGAVLGPGKMIRFRKEGMDIEQTIVQPVTRVELLGKCDEGDFRQTWQNTESGQLRLMHPGSQ